MATKRKKQGTLPLVRLSIAEGYKVIWDQLGRPCSEEEITAAFEAAANELLDTPELLAARRANPALAIVAAHGSAQRKAWEYFGYEPKTP